MSAPFRVGKLRRLKRTKPLESDVSMLTVTRTGRCANGSLLRAILEREPSATGIVFDLTYIRAEAQKQIDAPAARHLR